MMAKIINKAKETVTIELANGCNIVLDANKAKNRSPLILERYQASHFALSNHAHFKARLIWRSISSKSDW